MGDSLALILRNGRTTVGPLQPTLVLRPAAPANSGNVFTSWAALAAVAATIEGPYSIFFDTSGAGGDGNCHVTIGAWVIGPDCTFIGDPDQAVTDVGLVFDDGATLDFWPLHMVDLWWQSQSTAAIVTVANPSGSIFFQEGAAMASCTITPALTSPDLVFVLCSGGVTIQDSGSPVFEADTLAVLLLDVTNLNPNTLTSPTVIEIVAASPAATYSPTQLGGGAIFVGFAGGDDYAAAGGNITTPGAGGVGGSWGDSGGIASGGLFAHAHAGGVANGKNSIGEGLGAISSRTGQRAFASGSGPNVNPPLSAQASDLVFTAVTPGAAPGETTNMQYGSAEDFVPTAGIAYLFVVEAEAASSAGDTASWSFRALVDSTGALIGQAPAAVTPEISSGGAATWTLTTIVAPGFVFFQFSTGASTAAVNATANVRFVEEAPHA